MKITIVSVVLNAKNNIGETIQSILSQTYKDIEYIIIDGESNDGTIDILKKYESKITKLLIEKDNGLYDAMNKALEISTGDFLIFMNSGDSFVTSYIIEGVVNSIKINNAIYYGNVILLNPLKKNASFFGGYFGKHRLCFKNICHQSVFYPNSVYKTHKYDLTYKIFADYMYNITLKAEKVHFIHLKTIISFFELGGLSDAGDEQLAIDKGKIILNNFGFYYYIYYILKKNVRIRPLIKSLKELKTFGKKRRTANDEF